MASDMFKGVANVRQGLDAAWLRQEVILNNIANADTPNFNRSMVSFEDQYKRALLAEDTPTVELKKTRAGHRDINFERRQASPRVYTDTVTTIRMDGNNVDMEIENTELLKNTLYYETLQREMNSQFTQLKMAITEGG